MSAISIPSTNIQYADQIAALGRKSVTLVHNSVPSSLSFTNYQDTRLGSIEFFERQRNSFFSLFIILCKPDWGFPIFVQV